MVIQGLGNVGSYAGIISQKEGGVKVIAISEIEGTIIDKNGIDIEKLLVYRKKNKTIIGFPGSEEMMQRDEWIGIDCDILVPAALESQIHANNAKKVRAKVIGEAANGPVTADAEEILLKKGVVILPDMYLNAGGVTVSYFEWLKNLSHMRFGRMEKRFNQRTYANLVGLVEKTTGKSIGQREKDYLTKGADEVDLVRSGLEETMVNSYNQVMEYYYKKDKISDLRTAAFSCALNKVANDYMILGVFP
jgi:glutamate dehydrogenase (NAD(P)+)